MVQILYPSSFSLDEVTFVKGNLHMKVGLSLRKNNRQSALLISGLTDNSPLRGTLIRPSGDQLLLAVNGNPDLPSASAAVDLIASSTRLSFLICDQPSSYETTVPPLVQVVAAPFWKHTPAINFGSTRGRTLVTIGKIFQQGPFADCSHIQPGDLVLAVNGIPVSKPEDADRALRFPKPTTTASGSSSSFTTVLHIVNMTMLRSQVMKAVDQQQLFRRDNNHFAASILCKPIPQQPHAHMMVCRRVRNSAHSQSNYLSATGNGGDQWFRVEYNTETQHMEDPEPFTKLVAESAASDHHVFAASESASGAFGGSGSSSLQLVNNPKVLFKNWYTKGACRIMARFNQLMDESLDPLEDLACETAWRHPPPPPVVIHPSLLTHVAKKKGLPQSQQSLQESTNNQIMEGERNTTTKDDSNNHNTHAHSQTNSGALPATPVQPYRPSNLPVAMDNLHYLQCTNCHAPMELNLEAAMFAPSSAMTAAAARTDPSDHSSEKSYIAC